MRRAFLTSFVSGAATILLWLIYQFMRDYALPDFGRMRCSEVEVGRQLESRLPVLSSLLKSSIR